jgi:hypothetical protein
MHGRLLPHSTGHTDSECVEGGCGGTKDPEEEWAELFDAFGGDYAWYVYLYKESIGV